MFNFSNCLAVVQCEITRHGRQQNQKNSTVALFSHDQHNLMNTKANDPLHKYQKTGESQLFSDMYVSMNRKYFKFIFILEFYFYFLAFLTPAPKAGVIVVASAVRAAAAAGINFVGVPQTKPKQRFLPNFQDISTTKGSRADQVLGRIQQQPLPWQRFFRFLGLMPCGCSTDQTFAQIFIKFSGNVYHERIQS